MSKTTWIISAIVIIIISLFVGTAISDSQLLSFIAQPEQTEQIEISEGPWSKNDDILTTELLYETPAGVETNTITITLDASETIASFEMSIDTTNEVSIRYQEQFIAQLTPVIIGKKMSEIANLDTIAGASLTTDAFTQAFAQL